MSILLKMEDIRRIYLRTTSLVWTKVFSAPPIYGYRIRPFKNRPIFGYSSSKPMYLLFLRLPEKGPRPKRIIYKHVPISKIYHKSERLLCLLAHIFTKRAHNVCLINTHILVYQCVWCDCSLRNAPWFYSDFIIYFHFIFSFS